jgi:thioredoxin-related protein
MKRMIPLHNKQLQYILSTIFVFLLVLTTSCSKAETVTEIHDFQPLRTEIQEKGTPLLLVFRADGCTYCRHLEEEYLKPMQQSGDYDTRIIIRQLTLGAEDYIYDFQGKKVSADTFATRYKASITPTVVFLDANGGEVAESLVGYSSPDFYGAYLENAINTAQKAVKTAQGEKKGGTP